MGSIQGSTMIFGVPENRGAFLFPRRAHLLTTCKAGGGIPPVGWARALFTNCLASISPEGGRRLYVLPNQQNDEVAYCNPIPPPAYENSAQDNPSDMSGQLYRSDRYVVFSDTPIFSFGKEKQKNERTVKTNGDLSFRSKSS